MITTISDGKLFVDINSKGAELWRIYDSADNDFLWCGDSAFWGRRAPTLFPICGGMEGDGYIYEGKEYYMPKHGFCRDAEFTLEAAEPDRAVYLIRDTEGTQKLYPFSFEFRIEYAIENGALKVIYRVKNTGENTMYFSVGSHEAYACPEGIEGYDIEFEKSENLESLIIADNLIQPGKTVIGENVKRLKMDYRYFQVDALCFQNLRSKRISLIGKDRRLDVEFDGFEYVLLWTKPNAPFLCIELNCGIDDYAGCDRILQHKKGNACVESGKEFTLCHSMRFSKF